MGTKETKELPQKQLNKLLLQQLFCLFFLFQILMRSRQHQLDSIQLVYLAGARIVVNGHDVRLRVLVAEFFDNTLTYHVVWQAGKRLQTKYVFDSAVYEIHHLAGQEPSLSALISDGNESCLTLNVFLKIST